jgi:magnesium-transporting ATPase (P-type)
MTREAGTQGAGVSPRGIRIFFCLTGTYFGWRWGFEDHSPAWERALHVLATMLVALTLAQLVRILRARWTGRPVRRGGMPVRQLALTKVGLVALAIAVQYALHRAMAAGPAGIAVGVGLGASIALIGPALHRRHHAAHARPQAEAEAEAGAR